MRTIKFRGRSCGFWGHGNLHIRKHEDEFGDFAYIIGYTETPLTTIVDINTIGQFTGLRDKNGKEIYEGDIIRGFDSKGEPIIHYIQYDDEDAGFVAVLKGSAKGDFGYGRCYQQWITECEKEVIGNIHDNQELLKGK
jgi:uncharacterized phage protein (TIGR01671 family)